MDELIAEFLTETNESIQEIDMDLVSLEQNPNDTELLSKIFRLMHTIKGTCGFLGLPRLETVAHRAENVLGLFRDGVITVTPEYATLIFESVDRIKYILSEIEQNGESPEGNDEDLIVKLDAIYNKSQNSEESEAEEIFDANEEMQEIDTESSDKENQITAEELAEEPADAIDNDEAVPEAVETEMAPPKADTKSSPASQKLEAKESEVAAQSIRVSVSVIEDLMTMVSELVLTRNQLLQILRSYQDSEFAAPLQRLNHVVSDLQEGVMKTRMQPIGNAWSKLPRIIRDISIELNKKIDLEMKGKDTELDRQVLDLIKDPLTHMVRNSADHGIESPAERIALGKPETGKVVLNAYHEGGHIIIEISDDGKGLPMEKIKAKIIANGLASVAELEEMSDQQIQQFIFEAGFSTAEKVTSVSGRGVGMDVVRSNIEKIGGSIELNSVEGKGSRFLIKIPLTLAIVSALIVETGKEKFAIPQLAVRELVKPSANDGNKIERIKDSLVFRLRDRLLPLVSLKDILGIGSITAEEASGETSQYIVVTQIGAYTFGIIVDRVYDTEEIVVKPVSTILKSIDIFSGNTILGDGSVIMILDPAGVAKATGGSNSADKSQETIDENKHEIGAEKIAMLIFSAGNGAPKAVPLSLVARLENIKTASIETSSNQMMIQYRNELMPVVPFNDAVDMSESEKPTLVFVDEKSSMGLIVDKIIDVVEHRMDIQLGGKEEGVMGSAIINKKATDIIDVAHYLRRAVGDWYKMEDDPFQNESNNKRMLLVDDSPFFRNMLKPILNVAGYNVVMAENPIEALEICEEDQNFDVILSDIEMPMMNGFEFAKKIRSSDLSINNIPMIALTSHATEQDVQYGKDCGFNNHVAKFDRDTLLKVLNKELFSDNKGEVAL